MNVQALKQTNVIPTPCVPTLKDPTSVAVLVDIRVMEETAQVDICFTCFINVVKIRSTCTSKCAVLCFVQYFYHPLVA